MNDVTDTIFFLLGLDKTVKQILSLSEAKTFTMIGRKHFLIAMVTVVFM